MHCERIRRRKGLIWRGFCISLPFDGRLDMTSDVQVSVILPYFEGERWVGRSAASVLNQAGVPFELVVVDDGSGMPAESAARLLSDSRVRCFRIPHAGKGAALNFGAGQGAGRAALLYRPGRHHAAGPPGKTGPGDAVEPLCRRRLFRLRARIRRRAVHRPVREPAGRRQRMPPGHGHGPGARDHADDHDPQGRLPADRRVFRGSRADGTRRRRVFRASLRLRRKSPL